MTTPISREHRLARLAVALLFLTNGALFANILPRYPEIKNALEMSNAIYGVAVAAFPVGAIVAGLGAGVLIRRFGSARVAVVGTVLTGAGVFTAGIAPSIWFFALGLFLAGAMDAVTDVAQNAHGLRVQRRYRRSILNSFHAVWSIGAVLGGSMAALAIALNVPIWLHLAISGVTFSVVSLLALRFCFPGLDEDTDAVTVPDASEVKEAVSGGFSTRILLVLIALVGIAIAGTIVEDAGNSWATLYLTTLEAPGSIAALGYISLVGAQFIGRLVGDGMVDRFGQRAVALTGAIIMTVGFTLALMFPSVPGTIAGFAAAGFGVATLVPAVMSQADELPGLRRGTGLTIVSWLMRLGFLLSPPLIGVIADGFGLRAGLIVIPVAGVVVIAPAGVLRTRTASADGRERPES